jgi:hypothetical protein
MTFVREFDGEGREVLYEEDVREEGWDLRVTTEWDGDTRTEAQELAGIGLVRTVVELYRDDGQLYSVSSSDYIDDTETERTRTYDALGRVLVDERKRGRAFVETCTSTWSELADGWEQRETCQSGDGDTIAIVLWSPETRLPASYQWDRDADGVDEWVAYTEYREDCQVRYDEQVLPTGDGYERFVVENTVDGDGRLVRSTLTAIDDDGVIAPDLVTTELTWACR